MKYGDARVAEASWQFVAEPRQIHRQEAALNRSLFVRGRALFTAFGDHMIP
jgi:hypothetical protein